MLSARSFSSLAIWITPLYAYERRTRILGTLRVRLYHENVQFIQKMALKIGLVCCASFLNFNKWVLETLHVGESKKCLIGKKDQLVFFKSHIELFSKFEVADDEKIASVFWRRF